MIRPIHLTGQLCYKKQKLRPSNRQSVDQWMEHQFVGRRATSPSVHHQSVEQSIEH